MRAISGIILLSLLTSCAKPAAAPVARTYESAPASALVFEPPVAMLQPAPDLSRESRERGASVGFEQPVTTFFYLRFEDRDRGDGLGRIERRVVEQRYGVGSR